MWRKEKIKYCDTIPKRFYGIIPVFWTSLQPLESFPQQGYDVVVILERILIFFIFAY